MSHYHHAHHALRPRRLHPRLLPHQLRPSPSNTKLPRLHHPRLKHHHRPLLPHLRPQRLPRQHRPRKPDLDILEQPILLHHMLTANPKEAQPMQDRHIEPAHLAKLRVHVQGVIVATETVQRRLLLARLLLRHGVRLPFRRRVCRRRFASVARLLGPTEAAGAADEDGALGVEDFFATSGVLDGGAGVDDAAFALVHDVDEARVGDELAFGGDGVFEDFEVLLAVEEEHGGEVGDEVGEGEGGVGVEWGDDAEGGEGLEGVAVFVNVGEVGSFAAYAEVWGEMC